MRESPFLEEIRSEGRIEGHRASVREVLEVRFGANAAQEFQEVLGSLSDSARLSELHRLAIRCRRISEFRRALLTDTAAH